MDVYGGVPPYRYYWTSSHGKAYNTENLAWLPAGVYRLTATDANGCRATRPFQLNDPPPLTLEVVTRNNTVCAADAEMIPEGGTPPYAYFWSNGAQTREVQDISAGVYVAQVRDANGCAARAKAKIGENPMRIVVNVRQDITCAGAGDGEIAITVYGGAPPYAYEWSNPAAAFASSVQDIRQLDGGAYALRITDARNCVFDTTITLREPETLRVRELGRAEPVCASERDGRISVGGSGGTMPYEYQWDAGASGPQIEDLGAGTYTVTLTDANGCQAIYSATLEAPAALRLREQEITPVSCFGGADGAIAADVEGGTPPYTYEWKNGAPTENLSGAAPGVHWLEVRDANGCREKFWFDIPEPEPLEIKWDNIEGETCAGAGDGALRPAVSGGTPRYRYAWSNGRSAELLNNLAGGNYGLTVTDANGCRAEAEAEVGQGLLEAEITFARAPRCANGEDGLALARANSGGRPVTWRWYRDNEEIAQGSPFATGLAAGRYRAVASIGPHCEAVAETLLAAPEFLRVIGTATSPACADGADGRNKRAGGRRGSALPIPMEQRFQPARDERPGRRGLRAYGDGRQRLPRGSRLLPKPARRAFRKIFSTEKRKLLRRERRNAGA